VNDWLPEHQTHLFYTFAHIDSVIDQLGNVLYGFLEAGPLDFENRVTDGREDVLIRAIAPIPEAVPRLASDALNQMRSAIEHALFAEVEHLTGRTLEPEEAQAIEMPVTKDPKALSEWFKHKRRRTLPVIQSTGVLGGRIAALQPHEAADEQSHLLRVLAEHTNLSKHRTPAVAAVRLGTIVPDHPAPGLVITGEYEDDSPLNVGDVLASVPAGVRVPMNIWPKLGIRRPHTGEWIVLIHELRQLETWVRTEAIPLIIMGTTDVNPIPPHLDITRGYTAYADARAEAKAVPAGERHQLQIAGKGVREDLPGVFQQRLPEIPGEAVDAFVGSLSDADAVETIKRYMRVRENRGELHAVAYLRRLVSAAVPSEGSAVRGTDESGQV
jgi:hypothetical protein